MHKLKAGLFAGLWVLYIMNPLNKYLYIKLKNNQMISGVEKKYQNVNFQVMTWMNELYQSMNKFIIFNFATDRTKTVTLKLTKWQLTDYNNMQ
jgi:hypothetical protein